MTELLVTQPNTFSVRAAPVNPVTVNPGGPTVLIVPTPGVPGPPGSGTGVLGEIPTGLVNGSNTVFTTSQTYRSASTAVYLNGLREFHYTETSSTTITFSTAPGSGDDVRIDYTH